jgi:hypothetical protein
VGHAKFKQTGVDLKELEMASMMLVYLVVEQRESTHAKKEFTTCRVVQEQKKRPLSWVELELPFRLHMTNKCLAIPNIFAF